MPIPALQAELFIQKVHDAARESFDQHQV